MTATDAASLEVPSVMPQVVLSVSARAASRSVDIALLILPNSEICALIAVLLVCSASSGLRSIAINCVMIELTSRPLPMPGELMVMVRPSQGGEGERFRKLLAVDAAIEKPDAAQANLAHRVSAVMGPA
ncbi:MAG TPA: hypothetical protein PKC97_18155 [Burkholderiaceae bacterium]|nr:hypothetical protein [Burkholderiaceae bacterium]